MTIGSGRLRTVVLALTIAGALMTFGVAGAVAARADMAVSAKSGDKSPVGLRFEPPIEKRFAHFPRRCHRRHRWGWHRCHERDHHRRGHRFPPQPPEEAPAEEAPVEEAPAEEAPAEEAPAEEAPAEEAPAEEAPAEEAPAEAPGVQELESEVEQILQGVGTSVESVKGPAQELLEETQVIGEELQAAVEGQVTPEEESKTFQADRAQLQADSQTFEMLAGAVKGAITSIGEGSAALSKTAEENQLAAPQPVQAIVESLESEGQSLEAEGLKLATRLGELTEGLTPAEGENAELEADLEVLTQDLEALSGSFETAFNSLSESAATLLQEAQTQEGGQTAEEETPKE